MAIQDRLKALVAEIPVAHRAVIGAVAVALALAAAAFLQWVMTPSYTVLYAGLDDRAVSEVITELESLGIPYQLENGGTTVSVPQAQLFDARARLAGAGVATSSAPAGYELLDGQGITISDFKQRVDFQRAVEGELAKTLMSMDAIRSAQVHLVLPEDELFRESTAGATASVLVDPVRPLSVQEVETITFLVSSAVEGLAPGDVTVADVQGNALNAPGDLAGSSVVTDRNMRTTREFEAATASDIQRLLDSALGAGRASVVVKAALDFDERETESERYDAGSQVALREQTTEENYVGDGSGVGGTVGVDGGPITQPGAGTTDYTRAETVREFGVDRVVDRTTAAPGTVETLSVAIVVDDGSLTGLSEPDTGLLEQLVTAAVGLDTERGDTLAVSAVPFPAPEEVEETVASNLGGLVEMVPQVIGVLVVLLVAVALFLMTRRSKDEEELPRWLPPVQAGAHDLASLPVGQRVPVAVGAGGGAAGGARGDVPELAQRSVAELVEQQPEEIAMLLRSWLADGGGR